MSGIKSFALLSNSATRTIVAGLLPDGLDVSTLSPAGRAEVRRAVDQVLDLAAETTHVVTPAGEVMRIPQTPPDLKTIAETFRRALKVGAPGLSDTIRTAIVTSALIRLRETYAGAGHARSVAAYCGDCTRTVTHEDVTACGRFHTIGECPMRPREGA
jgi:hypothetical protein